MTDPGLPRIGGSRFRRSPARVLSRVTPTVVTMVGVTFFLGVMLPCPQHLHIEELLELDASQLTHWYISPSCDRMPL